MSKAESVLQERLEAVARTMEASPEYTPVEIFAWRRLAQHVDPSRFERTGQIVTSNLTPERIAYGYERRTAGAGYHPGEVAEALAALEEKEHLAVVQRKDEPVRYRLLLNPTSTDQEAY